MKSLGVIIARFQVDELTFAHKDLIDHVTYGNDDTLILLGVPAVPGKKRDPLSFSMRHAMVRDYRPEAYVAPLPDIPGNGEEWTRQVDRIISSMFPRHSVRLYGGRDSCINYYQEHGGRFPTMFVHCGESQSGTEARAAVKPSDDKQFRAGVIWHSENRYDSVLPVVDMAIFKGDNILLARKPTDKPGLWRLIGGFVDGSDPSYEFAAVREVAEETGLEVGPARYVGSCNITDARYYGGPETVKSAVFALDYIFGQPKAADDISEVRWFPVNEAMARIAPIHADALTMAIVDHEKRRPVPEKNVVEKVCTKCGHVWGPYEDYCKCQTQPIELDGYGAAV